MNTINNVAVSIVLNDMDRTEFALHSFRSWLLQDFAYPYEVIINLFNDKDYLFERLSPRNPNAIPIIKRYSRPTYFNISAANNLGLHFATGNYVMFANSDIIYPSSFLSMFISEILTRGIYYALGSRCDLYPDETNMLEKALENDLTYDFLLEAEFQRPRMGTGGSPWTISRDIALAIGGFDMNVLCHEDSDFNERVIHYLRRTKRQQCIFTLLLFGYHIYHKYSELYAASSISKAIIEPRARRLAEDKDSEEDMIDNKIENYDSLITHLYKTKAPPIDARDKIKNAPMKIYRRLSQAYQIIRFGRV